MVNRLNLSWSREDVLRGRAIEDRLIEQLYGAEGFTIIPALKRLRTPTLIIHGDYDFVPVPCVTHIADAIPGSRLVVLEDSGHFSYVDAPEKVHKAIDEFFAGA